MTPFDYQSAIARLGLTQVGAGRFFGYNDRTVRRWAEGEQPIPRIIEIVIWLMLKFNVKHGDIPPQVDDETEFYNRIGGPPVQFTRPEKPRK